MIDSWVDYFYQLLSPLGYRHPVHPALVHLPIGLVAGAFIFGWLGLLSKREGIVRSAGHCLILAFLSWFPVVLFGLMDWQHFYRGAWLLPIKIKMVLSGILFLLFLLGAWAFISKGKFRTKALLILSTLGLFVVGLLGFFGGQLVYRDETPRGAKAYAVGENIFVAQCVICHPQGGNLIRPDRPIRNSSKLKDLEAFISLIRRPKAPMPPFPDTQISLSQAKELFEYINEGLVQIRGDSQG
jgi:uncharacterized membrane protein